MRNCYLDSNLLIYYTDANSHFHNQAVTIIKKLNPNLFQLYISPLVIDEYLYALRKIMKNKKLSDKLIYVQLYKFLDRILSLRHLIIINPPTEKINTREVITLMKDFHLRPRDAYHLLIMRENAIKEFATFDTDFRWVFAAKIIKPAGL